MKIRIGVMTCLLLGGCSAPSVVPLLEASRQAVLEEAGRLEAETQRDAAWTAQSREALASAFDADLADQATLDTAWVREATTGYVAAREALLRHELELREERHQRAANLTAAARAQQRAIDLLQHRDAILRRVGGDVLDLMQKETPR